MLNDHEIFRRSRRVRRSRHFRGAVALESLAQLSPGDYVVHMDHVPDAVEAHGQALVHRHSFGDLANFLDHGAERKSHVFQRELPVLAARDEQQLLDQFGRPVELALHGSERVANLHFRAALGGRPLHLRAQMR